MKEGPDIARMAALIGDPARANMLMALMSGKALTAGELAAEAGVTPATASSHLRQMDQAGLIRARKQGRHRYFTLADDDVGQALEALMGLAAARGHLRTRTGPRDPALRAARVCYDHLAGARGVAVFDSMAARGFLQVAGDGVALTGAGRDFVAGLGVDSAAPGGRGRPLCRACLDWSERRSHLGGRLGAALLTRFCDLGWARREADSRVVHITDRGAFDRAFPAAQRGVDIPDKNNQD
ncbi:ArsR/SmtB family transcription factor [Actibacterium sp. D379-3]